MSSDKLLPIAKLILPEVLVNHLELTKHQHKGEELHFYFTELNNTPEEFKSDQLHSKDFFSRGNQSRFPYTRDECLPSYNQA